MRTCMKRGICWVYFFGESVFLATTSWFYLEGHGTHYISLQAAKFIAKESVCAVVKRLSELKGMEGLENKQPGSGPKNETCKDDISLEPAPSVPVTVTVMKEECDGPSQNLGRH